MNEDPFLKSIVDTIVEQNPTMAEVMSLRLAIEEQYKDRMPSASEVTKLLREVKKQWKERQDLYDEVRNGSITRIATDPLNTVAVALWHWGTGEVPYSDFAYRQGSMAPHDGGRPSGKCGLSSPIFCGSAQLPAVSSIWVSQSPSEITTQN